MKHLILIKNKKLNILLKILINPFMQMSVTNLELLAKKIVDSFYQVHKEMGPGLLESIYTNCLITELKSRNLEIFQEVQIPLYYKGQLLPKEFRLDLIVENEIIIEVKSVEVVNPVYAAQIISYLKLTKKRIGFVVNFNVPLIKKGIRRYVNELKGD